MKLFLISQDQVTSWGFIDSAVVAAPGEAEARLIDPSGNENNAAWQGMYWCSSPDPVSVQYIGEAAEHMCQGIVLVSFKGE